MKAHQEMDEAQGCTIGRDPRHMSRAEIEAIRPRISRGDAIRAKCLDCAGGSQAEVRRCGLVDCTLWPFRMGTDPYRMEMSEQRKQEARERFMKVRGLITDK